MTEVRIGAQRGASIAAVGFGLSMAAATGPGSHGPALAATVVAVVAVPAGIAFRPAATLAVLFTAAAIALSEPAALPAALSGLSAVAYLVLRYASSIAQCTWPTAIAAVGFTLIGLVAGGFPLQLPWLPLLAAPAAFAVYVLAVRPFAG